MAPGTLQAAGGCAHGFWAMTHADFWPRYLAAHADWRTRALHYLGTGGAVMLLGLAGIVHDWRPLVAAPIIGYGFAWLGHALFERNRPETFSHPLWSLVSDIRMLGLFLTGRIGRELRRRQIER
jgi:hypothetical protein